MAAARKTAPPESIESDKRYAEASLILRTLEGGARQIERDADALRLEEYLAAKPKGARANHARDRLATLRSAPREAASAAASSSVPPAVIAALEIIRDGRRPAGRASRKMLIADLETDRELVREAISLQTAVLDAIRGELSHELATRLKAAHRELVLAQYRAAQSLATATDAERELRSSVTGAGYLWRDDLLPAPALRSALLLGSESVFDSEISRTRRLLEELKAL